ncbi:MAG: hypothetical protein KatS3mg057_2377 [Herpetosiphonaceae bacterium]|nr:MAG: hypothetical protein KatS3mg057_2377 [Herpetosiphonaceae bacterium]
MFSRSIVLAGLIGFWIDITLTILISTVGFALLGISTPEQLQFSNPAHILVGLVLPAMMTMIGGAVAGALAMLNPQPAGALVGGFGLFLDLLMGSDPGAPHALTFLIAQCVATVLAALSATFAARYRLRAGR